MKQPWQKNYGPISLGSVVQETRKQRSVKEMASLTVGILGLMAAISLVMLLIWPELKLAPRAAPDAYQQLFGK